MTHVACESKQRLITRKSGPKRAYHFRLSRRLLQNASKTYHSFIDKFISHGVHIV